MQIAVLVMMFVMTVRMFGVLTRRSRGRRQDILVADFGRANPIATCADATGIWDRHMLKSNLKRGG